MVCVPARHLLRGVPDLERLLADGARSRRRDLHVRQLLNGRSRRRQRPSFFDLLPAKRDDARLGAEHDDPEPDADFSFRWWPEGITIVFEIRFGVGTTRLLLLQECAVAERADDVERRRRPRQEHRPLALVAVVVLPGNGVIVTTITPGAADPSGGRHPQDTARTVRISSFPFPTEKLRGRRRQDLSWSSPPSSSSLRGFYTPSGGQITSVCKKARVSRLRIAGTSQP